jgi:hypothetical protein
MCYAVNQLSQAMVKPTKLFWKAGKHVLDTSEALPKYGLWYRWTEGVKLQGFTDADWVGSPSDRRVHQEEFSVLGQQQFLGTTGSKDQWHSAQQKQNTWLQVKQHVRPSG